MADAGCDLGRFRGSHGSPRRWLCLGRGEVFISVPDTGCRGGGGGFTALQDAGGARERRVFSFQSQMLVVEAAKE